MTHLDVVGKTLERFQLLSTQGQGGMALVYMARQTDLDRLVALKILRPELTHDSATVARFHQEARSAARLDHPHIIPIYEIGELEYAAGMTLHYIAMKYMQSGTVKDLLAAEGRLSIQQAIDIMLQAGAALTYAHQQGVIHRDVKPANMLLGNDGTVYLADFGLACCVGSRTGFTRTGMVMGTPEYMSPEQAEGQANLGVATDVYALGVVFYELLTGDYPFQADTPMGMVVARLMQEPRPIHTLRSDIPQEIQAIITRALARNPEARFASVSEMMAALRRIPTTAMAPASTGQTVSVPQPPNPAQTVTLPQHTTDTWSRWIGAGKPSTLSIASAIGAVLVLFVLAGLFIFPIYRTETPIAQPTPIISTQPGAADAFYNQGRVLMAQGNYAAAYQQFIEALQHDSQNADIHAWMGRAALLSADYEQAEVSFRRAISLEHSNTLAMTGLSWALYYQNAFNEARDQFEQSLALDSTQPEAHLGLGWTLHAANSYAGARRHFAQAVELDPDNANAWYGLGDTLEKLDRFDEARTAYQSAVDIDPDNQDAREGLERLQ